jgi:threonylcarbamoyladenosine tRNA methylthiotransferase MtaB
MRRRYTTGLYRTTVERIYQLLPHAAITADVIVGFPGEGEAEFDESLRFCEEVDLAGMHVFPYSARPGTSAAFMVPKVEELAKGARMSQMLALAREKAFAFRQRHLGTVRPVLWEREKSFPRVYSGLTDNYLRVKTRTSRPLNNQVALARLLWEQGESLYSELV